MTEKKKDDKYMSGLSSYNVLDSFDFAEAKTIEKKMHQFDRDMRQKEQEEDRKEQLKVIS